jgi:hypothetical protein
MANVDKYAIWAQLEAKPGKEQEVEEFLKSALPLAQAETGTTTWFAVKMSNGSYGIFDTFADEDGRNVTSMVKSLRLCLPRPKIYLPSHPRLTARRFWQPRY